MLSAEILLPPHCSHLYRNSGSLLDTHSCQMQTLLPDRPLHLLREILAETHLVLEGAPLERCDTWSRDKTSTQRSAR